MATQLLLKVLRAGGGKKYGNGDIIECEPSGFQWGGQDLCVNLVVEIPEDLTAVERKTNAAKFYLPGDEGGVIQKQRLYKIDYAVKVTDDELKEIWDKTKKCKIITGKFVKSDIVRN